MRAGWAALLAAALAASAGAAPASVELVRSEAEFDALSAPAPGGARKLLFVADHRGEGSILFIDSRRYPGHLRFLREQLLTAKDGPSFMKLAIDSIDRTFTLGWIARRPGKGYAVEFWEDDLMSARHASAVWRLVKDRFFTVPALTIPRAWHRVPELEGAPLARLAPEDVYRPLNPGTAVGVLRVGGLGDTAPEDAVLVVDDASLEETPLTAALILRRPASPASHIAILSQSLGIPCAIAPEWDARPWEGKRVEIEVGDAELRVKETRKKGPPRAPRAAVRLPAVLSPAPLLDLASMRGGDWIRYGAKAANLGEAWNSGIKGMAVPRGFGVPFHEYAAFLRENGLQELVRRAAASKKTDPALLEELRRRIEGGRVPAELEARLRAKLAAEYDGRAVFVRSSTNAEDLPRFTGAGLHKTVPNVRGADGVLRALREVWASLWNARAFEARRLAGIDQSTAFAGVLIQESVDSDAAGVLLTEPPVRAAPGAVFIAAKRGLGIRVVDGYAVPEQIVYEPDADRALTLTRSGDETELRLAEGGGVAASPVEKGAVVLEHAAVRRLGGLGASLERHFGGAPLEIDWALDDGKVWILQARRLAR